MATPISTTDVPAAARTNGLPDAPTIVTPPATMLVPDAAVIVVGDRVKPPMVPDAAVSTPALLTRNGAALGVPLPA